MDWIIRRSRQIKFHTDLDAVTKPIKDSVCDFNWLLSDLDFMTDYPESIPINFDQDYFFQSGPEFQQLVSSGTQIIWGVILAIPTDMDFTPSAENLPYVEGNDRIWEPGGIQLKEAEIEIDCFDSSYTILKFRQEALSDKFKRDFPEAIALAEFR